MSENQATDRDSQAQKTAAGAPAGSGSAAGKTSASPQTSHVERSAAVSDSSGTTALSATGADSTTQADAKVAAFTYEEARSRLVDIVSTLEQGSLPLEDALAYWELGEALARRCQSLLDGARQRLDAQTLTAQTPDTQPLNSQQQAFNASSSSEGGGL